MFAKYSLCCRASRAICLVCWVLLIPQFFCATTTCPPPDFPDGGSYRPEKSEYEVGSRVSYFCKDKFTMFGADRRTCQSSGRWSGDTPFCDSPAKTKNPTASSRVDSRESAVIDGSPNTCFRTRNGTEEFVKVFLDRPSIVYAVRMNLPKGKTSFKITLSEHRYTRPSNAALCHSYETDLAENDWVRFICKSNEVRAEYLTVQVNTDKASSISLCEMEVYTKDDEWCRDPPENFIPNGQLEVSRNKAELYCNEGYKELNNRRVYATCESNKWSNLRLQCIDILCDSAVTNVSHSEGEWYIDGKTSKLSVGTRMSLKCKPGYKAEGNPFTVTCLKNGNWTRTSATCKREKQKDYKIIAIAVGSVVVIVILGLLGLTIYLIQKKKAREVVVIYKPGENNSYSNPPSVGGHSTTGLSEAEYSTVYYEAIQGNQFDPRAPPPKLPNITPKLDRGYSKPVDDSSKYSNTANKFPTDLAFGTLTKSSSLYNSMA